MKNFAIATLLALITWSCTAQRGEKIKGNGTIKTIERMTPDYDNIAISGFFDVDLIEGNEGDITITGEENLLDYIILEVEKGKLVIKIEKGVNLQPSKWKNAVKITIPIESIDGISLSGSGDIVSKTTIKTSSFTTNMSGSGDITLTLETQSTKASMSGSGDINLSGSTKKFEATISGSGDIEAFDLDADYVEATVSGSASIKVTANKAIKARVSGSGDIYYKGKPSKINTKLSGSGSITKN
ncbi:DUF2807 domain-containing protein [Cellulophaga sp. HaHaR_3_176]|uniref:head GIN domain-containing protein n=1 Tax=Cellulophaga sp. HaHaR_3_176 TaxID=1942464 RepID=UPI001C1FEE65|nr:head GIN domain-containing protein [Cellulophaga sp. HaHaR_3_176]QWX84698.1 DUF2807 domain-containing protein [Cellulophaga sp. HaHaR_3_176]